MGVACPACPEQRRGKRSRGEHYIDLWCWSADTSRVAIVLPVRIQEDRWDDKSSDLRSFKLDKDTPAGQLLPQSALSSQELERASAEPTRGSSYGASGIRDWSASRTDDRKRSNSYLAGWVVDPALVPEAWVISPRLVEYCTMAVTPA